MALKRSKARTLPGIAFELNDRVREQVKAMLPFKPTGAQKRVMQEIAEDMKAPRPMNRLLQGDVGSGKTIVAAEAAVIAIENGYQVAVLAPTEILATQHWLLFQADSFQAGLRDAAAHRIVHQPREGAAQEAGRRRPGARGDRHARAARKGRRVPEAGPRDRRRAASLRRDAAARTGAEGRASGRAGDDRDAHSAHAGHDALRRPGRLRDRRAAARPQADRHQTRHRRPRRAGLQLPETADRRGAPGVRGLSGDRGIGNAGHEGGAEDARASLARGLPHACGRADARPAGAPTKRKPRCSASRRARSRFWFRPR